MTATVEVPPVERSTAPTPTGLWPEELEGLSDLDTQALVTWHLGKAGDDDGRPWWPAAVRRLPLEARLSLASDVDQDVAWEARERQRVSDPDTGLVYFVDSYGHVQEEEGPPIPFGMWKQQRLVLTLMQVVLRLVVLKARQLGLTWLALHYAVWLMAFNPKTPTARVLALSKKGEDASKLLARGRRIVKLLPPYLRVREDRETRGSKTEMKLEGRGSLVSLMSTPDAARGETARLVIYDEAAFTRNGNAQGTLTALGPTLGRRGQLIAVSTGNGDENTPGDGQAFARLYRQASTGAELDEVGGTARAVFLPTSVHPDRDEAFYETARAAFLSDEEFFQEYPETEDQALAGKGGQFVYSRAGINAAEKLGRRYDALLRAGKLPPPVGGQVFPAIDYGEFTHGLIMWPLPGGGFYVPPCEVSAVSMELSEFSDALMVRARPLLGKRQRDGTFPIKMAWVRYDSAGAQSHRTFVKTVEEGSWPDGVRYLLGWAWLQVAERRRIRSVPVAFGKFKDESKDYVRHLLKRTAENRAQRVLAISPENVDLLRQMRGLRLKDDGSGKIEKGDDHGPDALIAGVAPTARRVRERQSGK